MLGFRELTSGSDALSEIFGSTFGSRADQAELNQKMLDDEECRVLGAFDGDRLVGVSVVRFATPSPSIPSYEAFGSGAEMLRDRALGIFNVMAILPSHKRRGLATTMGRRQLDWLREPGAEVLVGISWQHGGADCSGPLFEAGGFVQMAQAEGFYRQTYQAAGQHCARCHPRDCNCLALLYVLET